MKQVVLLTGGSSGIGNSVARILAVEGCRVYEMSRGEGEPSGWVHIRGDVASEQDAKRAAEYVLSREGRIDVLINNAGFGISGAAEFTDMADAARQMDINFFGMARMCQAVLPHMRRAGRGRILNVSSVAAAVPIPFQAFYSASKAAVNAYSLALANEVRPYGVSVCAVMPGDIKTGFTSARKKQNAGDEAYGGRIARSVAKMELDEQSGMQPAAAGRAIARIARKRNRKPLYAIRLDYQAITLLARLLPARLLNWLVFRLYAR